MRLFRILHSFLRTQNHFNKNIVVTRPARVLNRFSLHYTLGRSCLSNQKVCKFHTEKDDEDEDEVEFPLLENEKLNENNAKYVLFKNSDDNIINELNRCTSIGEVLEIMKKFKHDYRPEHITQTILVLNDLKSVYCSINKFQKEESSFLFNLFEYKEFSELLNIVSRRISEFDSVLLSYLLLYLQKLGLSAESELMQNISLKLCDELLDDFSLERCAKLLKVIFTEDSVRPYYISLNLIPKIFKMTDEIQTVDDLYNLTLCLNKLHKIVTEDILEKYRNKLRQFLQVHKLSNGNYSTILRIIMFLNYPEWRHKFSVLTSECILLLKNRIHLLDVSELLMLYEVFLRIQEPGEMLNEIQRCAAKFWENYEENNSINTDTKLKLFISLLYFSPPLHKFQFQEEAKSLLTNCSGVGNLIMLQKIFSYCKISDRNVCKQYWKQCLKQLAMEENIQNIVKLCQNYMYFNTDVDNFRHKTFENKIITLIEEYVRRDDLISPSEFAILLKFTIVHGNKQLMDLLMHKMEKNYSEFSAMDCFRISQSIGRLTEEVFISKEHLKKIKELLHQRTKNISALSDCSFQTKSLLISAAAFRNDFDNFTIDNLFSKLKEMDYMSSKMLSIFSQLIIYTDNLVPEIINKCTEYIIQQRCNIIGFNAEKILYLCYHLAYYPINADKFFKAVIDIIIRDQERFSGVTFLQSALSLCFFNRLPKFLVKQIFNVEFMDKLDNELAICYSKDTYPSRVRKVLMELNRAVCLDYPEFNIPWFHKTYVEDLKRKYKREQGNNLRIRIEEHLSELAGSSKLISNNIVTPYGYHIDFVVNLDVDNKIVPAESEGIKKRVAILLVHQKAFTRLYVHLKGKYQMKKRHLEMLGYGVSILNYNDWSNLLYSYERIDYLKELILSEQPESMKYDKER